MKQLFAHALREVADGVLGDAILEVGIDAVEGIIRESSVVAVIMLNLNAMLSGKGLEGAFGGNGFDR